MLLNVTFAAGALEADELEPELLAALLLELELELLLPQAASRTTIAHPLTSAHAHRLRLISLLHELWPRELVRLCLAARPTVANPGRF